MKKVKILLALLFFTAILTNCAGTGTTNFSAINFEVPSNESAIFVVRKNKFTASAGLVKIILDGREIAQLGVGEMEKVSLQPGSHKVEAKIGSLLQIGIQGGVEAFIAEKGKSYFFIVDYDPGLLSGKWSLTPTTESGFRSIAN